MNMCLLKLLLRELANSTKAWQSRRLN